MNSYYQIGGEVVTCVLDGPNYNGTVSETRKTADRVMIRKAHNEIISAVDQKIPGYSLSRGIKGAKKARSGTTMVRRGLTIAAALAAADGPLPFGDAAAAAFLIGGGSYMIYSGAKDVIQN